MMDNSCDSLVMVIKNSSLYYNCYMWLKATEPPTQCPDVCR